ncbi:hypothetical protein P170DRAFT_457691 [Aspergillus steynii IBT 23096]|uniref:T6SS Phospholipase effector Tle1-like catalytic domain-containing protein n=1 Tax=Aspergillus steynii IBT 23096 TaxID=1392250 RepID=A0A2I2G3D6_9EURO|nr:uncharacterized protein P170DRAFT_457691 [Aspergillus steynii IBT 23096]PLB47389.1 hypothetical protein P170DRAFT_457691 [Aspergillus steynii IBT 23096]
MSEKDDREGSPPRELVLCFDGTGNNFREDDSESNIMKIFSMLDRSKENRSGIGQDISPGSWFTAAIKKSPLHKLHDEAHAGSFNKHVIRGYKFLARRWKPGSKVYLFGFSRGAYTARFLNEMLDFVGLISADNEEMIPFVWEAFVNWKFAPPGRDRKRAGIFLRKCRETLCRRIGWVDFLGLFDTVSSVDGMDWDFDKSNPIQPNPKTMRHAVSIDERRIKFQPVLFQEVRGQPGEMRMPRVSTWATGNESASDRESQAPVKLNPDFEEVYFAGDHSDVGGGWSGGRWRVSQIPLMWMVQEAAEAGLTFREHQLKRLGCFDPVKREYDDDVLWAATTAELHDSLNYSDPGKMVETMFWRVLECVPFKRPKVAPDGSVKDSRWHARGLPRPLPRNAKIHFSVHDRMRDDPGYRPYNLGVGKKLDISEWQRVEHEAHKGKEKDANGAGQLERVGQQKADKKQQQAGNKQQEVRKIPQRADERQQKGKRAENLISGTVKKSEVSV